MYEEIKMIPEITLYLPNQSGQLRGALEVLDAAKVNVQAFSIEAAGEYSTVRIICDDEKKAEREFKKYAYSFTIDDVFAIRLSHASGKLKGIAELFSQNKINIEYGYLTLEPETNTAIVLLRVKEHRREEAKKLLSDNGFSDYNEIPG
jgi:hypothetical protein